MKAPSEVFEIMLLNPREAVLREQHESDYVLRMADEIQANPVSLCTLAATVTELAGDLRDGLATARSTFILPTTAFGNSTEGGSFDTAYVEVTETAGNAAEDISGVLEGDVDRLYRIAFAYKETDEINAENMD